MHFLIYWADRNASTYGERERWRNNVRSIARHMISKGSFFLFLRWNSWQHLQAVLNHCVSYRVYELSISRFHRIFFLSVLALQNCSMKSFKNWIELNIEFIAERIYLWLSLINELHGLSCWCLIKLYAIKLFKYGKCSYKRGPQVFQKPRSHLQIPGARRMKRSMNIVFFFTRIAHYHVVWWFSMVILQRGHSCGPTQKGTSDCVKSCY
jgi:hypothetical protein